MLAWHCSTKDTWHVDLYFSGVLSGHIQVTCVTTQELLHGTDDIINLVGRRSEKVKGRNSSYKSAIVICSNRAQIRALAHDHAEV